MRFDRFIGTPYKHRGRDLRGWDCWGCARLIFQWATGIALPSWSTVADAMASGSWRQVDPPRRLDFVLMRGEPCHVGLMIDGQRMIHVERDGPGTVVAGLDDIAIRNRIVGFWRHEALI
jgi:cell wall-associated NlpC family hydrolase